MRAENTKSLLTYWQLEQALKTLSLRERRLTVKVISIYLEEVNAGPSSLTETLLS
jgi:hypothetical protein